MQAELEARAGEQKGLAFIPTRVVEEDDGGVGGQPLQGKPVPAGLLLVFWGIATVHLIDHDQSLSSFYLYRQLLSQ